MRIRRHVSWVSVMVFLAGFLMFFTACALAQGGAAQTSPAARTAQTPTAQPASQAPTPEKKETGVYTLSDEKRHKAVEYSRAGYRLYFIDFVYGLIVLWVILRFGLATKFRDWAEGASGVRFLQVVIFAP